MNITRTACALLAGVAALAASTAQAETARGIYVGAFGGFGSQGGQYVEQTGVADKRGDFNGGYPDFDLAVDVDGTAENGTAGLVGLHTGYEWSIPGSKLQPALELEGLYHWGKQSAELVNPETEELANVVNWAGQTHTATELHHMVEEHYGAGKHRFENAMDANLALLMANAVVSYDLGAKLTPYAGVGAGLAIVQARNATSYQTEPLNGSGPFEIDPVSGASVNHFNSRPNATDLAFAAQAKAGLRLRVTERLSAFGEYRLIHVGASDLGFGSTVYTGHSPTDAWELHNGSATMHNATIGIDLAL